MLAWLFGIPTSESHALIAGLSGAAIAVYGGLGGINGSEWVKVRNLYECEHSDREVMILTKLYEDLEACLEDCEDCTDILEGIVMNKFHYYSFSIQTL